MIRICYKSLAPLKPTSFSGEAYDHLLTIVDVTGCGLGLNAVMNHGSQNVMLSTYEKADFKPRDTHLLEATCEAPLPTCQDCGRELTRSKQNPGGGRNVPSEQPMPSMRLRMRDTNS